MPRILVAEDDTLVRRFLVRCLESGGFATDAVDDGGAAIARLERGGVDLVVTDYAMPGATGFEVIAAARRVDPTLPCLVVTAVYDLQLAVAAMAEGAAGLVPKPFKPDYLLAMVRGALERRRLAAEAARRQALGPVLEKFALILANTLEAKDLSTHLHCERLVSYAGALAAHLGLPESVLESVRLGACLHDIGKIAVPDTLLRKARSLTDPEWVLLRRHAEIGATILADVDGWDEVRRVVRHHHERFDGAGYPDRLRGPAIPIGARIVSVADAYDAMVAGRPYSAARPPDAALAELLRMRGTQFDPEVVDAFVALFDDSSPALAVVGRQTPRTAA